MMKKKEKTCIKSMILNFDLFKFLGQINLYISKLREKNAANKVINKIAEDFKKIVAVIKLKELK